MDDEAGMVTKSDPQISGHGEIWLDENGKITGYLSIVWRASSPSGPVPLADPQRHEVRAPSEAVRQKDSGIRET